MIKVRAEEQALMLWNRASGRTAILSGSELEILAGWLNGSKETGFIRRLRELALLPEDEPQQILHILNKSSQKKAPFRSLAAPESLHIELTSRCPLQCPQCYKEHGEQELSGGVLHNLIRQAEKAAVFQIALGGWRTPSLSGPTGCHSSHRRQRNGCNNYHQWGRTHPGENCPAHCCRNQSYPGITEWFYGRGQ